MARAALMVAVGPIVRNPRARHALQDLCRRHPGLYQKVRLFAHRRGLLATSKGQGPNLYGGNMLEFDPRYLPLSPQAQEIHAQLKQLMPTKDGQ
ncbi:hypothetical protein RAM80_24645 [Pseudomonas sp. App30]|uniref:hypothetical protein n=1 Tax=Pseudomonas sp. App30 TaxID=3068990 RepID=UPI003A7FE5B5